MVAKQAVKENLQCTSKYGHLRISQDICHVRMTDIEGFLTIYGHSDNLLNNNCLQLTIQQRVTCLHNIRYISFFTIILPTNLTLQYVNLVIFFYSSST